MPACLHGRVNLKPFTFDAEVDAIFGAHSFVSTAVHAWHELGGVAEAGAGSFVEMRQSVSYTLSGR